MLFPGIKMMTEVGLGADAAEESSPFHGPMPRKVGMGHGIAGLWRRPAEGVADFLFLAGEESGEADAQFGRAKLGEAERCTTATGVGHSESPFLSAKVVHGAPHVAVPVDSVERQIEMSVKKQHGRISRKIQLPERKR
jgi:hypothetical protein